MVNELLFQNKKANDLTTANINSLLNENTFTVTTGHQIGLATGPVYFIYKIASTIKLAQQLKKAYPTYHFVPVYWMATEDHDKEEINHIHLFNNKLIWDTPQTGAVGDFKLDGIHTFLQKIQANFRENNTDIETLLAPYKTAHNLAEATYEIVNHIFSSYGLIILDPNKKTLKKQAIPLFKKELLNQAGNDIISQTNQKLNELGYKTQIHPREINLFYLDHNIRERIVLEGENYRVLNTNFLFTEEEIIKELEKNPEKFSPNVALRPVYQELILPNLAYIGGPGELAYWLQLKKVFLHYGISFPVLILRNSLILIRKSILNKIEKLGVNPPDLFLETNALIKKYIQENAEISFDEEIKELERVFELAKNKAVNIDFSLEKTVIAELTKAQNSINMIKGKTIKAEKRNNEIAVNQLKNIKETLFPNNNMQERVDNLLNYYTPTLIKDIINHIDCFEKAVYLLEV